jgi:metal-responsive CopG/Arc/MetJ family transcriptional regulator
MLCYHELDMKTIAISIDETSLAAVDRLAHAAARRGGEKKGANRSEVVRQAVREFLARQRKHEREERDRRILSVHRDEIERQTASLLADQAEL